MFLGGTIVSRPNSPQVVVCGHKWSQELYRQRPEHQINPSGSCFVLDMSKPRDTPTGIFSMSDQSQFCFYIHLITKFNNQFNR